MPITPYLAGQAFEPETIRDMSAAFVAVCTALGLKAQDDPATRLVAEKIVEFTQRGVPILPFCVRGYAKFCSNT